MTPEEFLAAVEASVETDLEHLDSSVPPVDGSGRRTSESVLRAAAGVEAATRDRFAKWAEAAVDDLLHDTYLDAAEREAEHYERLLAELPDTSVEPSDGPVSDYLRDVHNPAERIAAGFVGRALVDIRVQAHHEAYFARRGEERRARIFRDLRTETEGDVERGADLLEGFCRMDDDWERALDAATRVVTLAVDEWATTDESDVDTRS